ncbi:LOW QUALITY PROTEIN: hypothetical protein CFOL_v3_29336 [Cephalotus follicularis]|uniref:Uncharacterized protein n=1 Tax=Cephalotus follicularis TaxID=3775 RepID=A0A1Q3D0C3_CEPFO|nr:LOW QUALITY PROTEIN: hypothetical protein CFOL_v3_29336 [Cephalotus follicularis]
MDTIQLAIEEHIEQMEDLVQKLSSEIRSGLRPAYMGFFHAIDWKEPWLMGLIAFHVLLLLTAIGSRKNTNFQMCLFILCCVVVAGVYFAENLNSLLGNNNSIATQNYFDPYGVFLSVLWSWPLLIISIFILVNTLFSLCYMIVRWKKTELRHRASFSRNKQD